MRRNSRGQGGETSIKLPCKRIRLSNGKLAFDASLPSSFVGRIWLAPPELNCPIETNEGSVAMRRCDLCWPDQQFALEYDSDTFHSDASELHLDSSRRSALEKAGIHVVSVTKNQVFSRGQLFNLATIASKRLGKRLSPAAFRLRPETRRNLSCRF